MTGNGIRDSKVHGANMDSGVATWAPSQNKDGLSKYGDLHYTDETVVRNRNTHYKCKTVLRPSQVYDGNPYNRKMVYS